MTQLYELAIEKKKIFPLWIFTDVHHGLYTGGRFLCFIGANWPVKIAASSPEAHQEALLFLNSGQWKLKAIEEDPEKKYVGFGFGDTPSAAFRHACFMSGHFKKVQT